MNEIPHLRQHVELCIEKGVYDAEILNLYTEEEFDKLQSYIDHHRDYLFTYAGLRQVVDKYLVQDRSSGALYETPQFMYMMIALTIFCRVSKRNQNAHTSGGTMTQSQNTKSTSQRQSWQGCEHHFVNLHLVFWLMLMTPSIVSLVVIWLLADTSHRGLVSVSTQVASGASTLKSEAVRFSTQALFHFSKSLKQLSDAAHKMASEVEAQQSTFPIWHQEIEDIIVLKNNKGN
jgi:ribonucleoside-diphosphate reductase alpha chain